MGLTKLAPALVRRLLRELARRQSRGAAARACGIHATTLDGWLRQGKAGRQPHAELRRAVLAIERECCRSFNLTPRRRQQLLRLLAAGHSRQAAARAVGVSSCTLWRWFRTGQAGAWPRHSRLHALAPARRRRLRAHGQRQLAASRSRCLAVQLSCLRALRNHEVRARRAWAPTTAQQRKIQRRLATGQSRKSVACELGIPLYRLRQWIAGGQAGDALLVRFVRKLQALEARICHCPAFTPERRRRILELLRQGRSRRQAARAAGIHEKTLYGWVRRARAGLLPLAPFLEQLETARYRYRFARLSARGRVSPLSWQSAGRKLALRYPDLWGKCRIRAALQEQLNTLKTDLARLEHSDHVTAADVAAFRARLNSLTDAGC